MVSLARADWLSVGIVVGVTAVGFALLPNLPADMAIHFSVSGTPNTYAPRFWAVVTLPVVMLAMILVVRGAARVDPPNDPRSIDVIVVGTTLLLGGVHLFVLGWNLGYRIPFSLVVAGILLWTTAIVGYVVVREEA
jgi:uncharacterized membrane protein